MKWRSLQESTPETDQRRLYEIFAERRELIARYVPAEIQAIHAKAVEELKQAGAEQKALKPGDKVPDFKLPDQNAELVRSAELVSRGPLILCFIRGRWCPFCVGQMEAMNAIVPELEKLGASFAAISPQTVHQSFLMADQHKLAFPMLSDEANRVARQFGLIYRVPDYQQEVYRRAFTNLPFINGDQTWELPIPATYILSANSEQGGQRATKVLYSSVNPDYMERPEPADVLAKLSQLFS